jgi:hypothetical protein
MAELGLRSHCLQNLTKLCDRGFGTEGAAICTEACNRLAMAVKAIALICFGS